MSALSQYECEAVDAHVARAMVLIESGTSLNLGEVIRATWRLNVFAPPSEEYDTAVRAMLVARLCDGPHATTAEVIAVVAVEVLP